MARTVGIGHQDFEQIRIRNNFYIDKTHFIKEWWEAADDVTQITRPRRFGKTLNMSMLEKFFSIKYAGRGELFEGLSVWEDKKYRELQGTYPVISLSFANVKGADYEGTRYSINQILEELYNKNIFLFDGDFLSENEKAYVLILHEYFLAVLSKAKPPFCRLCCSYGIVNIPLHFFFTKLLCCLSN